MQPALPAIPAKRYFTIGEVSELCGVKPHVLRYWEQEFAQLRPMKRRGNRRYYQHHEVLLVRRIRDLLYEQGFTINGARGRLSGSAPAAGIDDAGSPAGGPVDGDAVLPQTASDGSAAAASADGAVSGESGTPPPDAGAGRLPLLSGDPSGLVSAALVRRELTLIRDMLAP
jgi:DNA-binding transcriptional MerR regulator